MTVNFGQPKRWVLPPVTVHEGARTDSEVKELPLPKASTPEVAKPAPVAIGSLVAKSPEAVRANRVEIPASLPSNAVTAPSTEQIAEEKETVRAYSLPNMVVNSQAQQEERHSQDKVSVPIKWITASHETSRQVVPDAVVAPKANEETQVTVDPPRIVGSYLDQLSKKRIAIANPGWFQHSKDYEHHGSRISCRERDCPAQSGPSNACPIPRRNRQEIGPNHRSRLGFHKFRNDATIDRKEKRSKRSAIGTENLDVPANTGETSPKTTSDVVHDEQPKSEVAVDEKPSIAIKVAEPKLLSPEAMESKSEPQLSRLTPMVLKQPEMPVVLNRVDVPPIAAATVPTWDAISDQPTEDAAQIVEDSKVAIVAKVPESIEPVEETAQQVETSSPSALISSSEHSMDLKEISAKNLPSIPTAEIALLTLEKIEPVGAISSDNAYSPKSSHASTATVYSLNDHSDEQYRWRPRECRRAA